MTKFSGWLRPSHAHKILFFAMWQVSEIGLILFSKESCGDCLGIGVTTADFKRGCK